MRTLLLLSLSLALAPTARAQDCLAYRRATVETLGKVGRLENAIVVIRGGKIEAVGKDIPIPEDAKVIDAAGCTIMPGLVEACHEIAIAGGGDAGGGGQTVVIRGRPVTLPGGGLRPGGAFTRVAENLNPYDRAFRPYARTGLVAMNLIASGTGQSAIVQLTPAEPDAMLIQPDGIIYTSASNTSESLEAIRSRLDSVARLKRTGGSPAGTSPSSTAPASTAPAGGPGGLLGQLTGQMKPWIDAYEGKAPIFVQVANAATVLHLAKIMAAHKDVRWVLLANGESLADTLDALKGQKVTVLVRPQFEFEPNSRARMNIARRLHEAGIPFAFSFTANPPAAAGNAPFGFAAGGGGTASGEFLAAQDFPLFAVAMMVKAGLPRQAALEAVSTRPAQLLGLGATHGSIEPGKAASLLLFEGDPLDPRGKLKAVLVGGKTVYED